MFTYNILESSDVNVPPVDLRARVAVAEVYVSRRVYGTEVYFTSVTEVYL